APEALRERGNARVLLCDLLGASCEFRHPLVMPLAPLGALRGDVSARESQNIVKMRAELAVHAADGAIGPVALIRLEVAEVANDEADLCAKIRRQFGASGGSLEQARAHSLM